MGPACACVGGREEWGLPVPACHAYVTRLPCLPVCVLCRSTERFIGEREEETARQHHKLDMRSKEHAEELRWVVVVCMCVGGNHPFM